MKAKLNTMIETSANGIKATRMLFHNMTANAYYELSVRQYEAFWSEEDRAMIDLWPDKDKGGYYAEWFDRGEMGPFSSFNQAVGAAADASAEEWPGEVIKPANGFENVRIPTPFDLNDYVEGVTQ